MLPKDQPTSVTLRRDEFRSAIERVAQFADERSRAIRLQILPGEFKVHSSLSETGESEESIPGRVQRPADRRSVSTRSTCSIFCAPSPEEDVAFHFRDAQSAGEMRPARRRWRQRIGM